MYESIDAMPLEKKVGQLFMVGFPGPTPSADIRALVREYNVGGVIYFSRNVESPEQVASLSGALQEMALQNGAGQPLFVATDQEGGVVSRLDWGATLPGQMLIGACGDPRRAEQAGRTTGQQLRAVGITMNLAPVLDVNNNPDNPVIGVRSFGEDPGLVGELGSAVGRGLRDAGVLACGKHFPGHGDTDADSHESLPVVDHERDRLDRVEFAPFRDAIAGGIEAIMTTHVSFPALTNDPDLPATISPAVQRGLLREEFGFEGLIVTDCLEMEAIAGGVGTAEGAVRAVEAGCDVVMVSHTPARQRAAIDAVVDAVRSGRLSEARIDASLERISDAKRTHVRSAGEVVTREHGSAAIERAQAVAYEVAACGVTEVRADPDTLPFDERKPLHVVGFTGQRGSEAEDQRYHPSMVTSALADAGAMVESHVDISPGHVDSPEFDGGAQVVVASYDARSNPEQVAVVEALEARDVALAVLAVRSPYDLAAFPDIETFVTTYDYSPGALAAGADVLLGNCEPTGRLPISIPDSNP